MPMPNNASVALLIAGRVHDNWTSYEIDSDLLTPADAFSVRLGLPDGVIPPEIHAGANVEVRVDRQTVLTGFIDDVDHVIDAHSHTLIIRGRDAASLLLDCSAPLINATELSLEAIVAQLVKPLGITKIRLQSTKKPVLSKVQIEPGARVWDVLIQYCEANGLWPWFEPDGTLVIGGPDYNTPPVADLIVRKNDSNTVRLSLRHSVAERYSEVTVLGQSHTGKSKVKATAKDTTVKPYRPLIVTDGDVENAKDAMTRARKILSDSRLKGFTLEATVRGHYINSNQLWTPGQRITVRSVPHNIDAVYFLIARTFSGGADKAATTRLVLKEDGAWVLDANPGTAKRKAKKSKTKKTPAGTIENVHEGVAQK